MALVGLRALSGAWLLPMASRARLILPCAACMRECLEHGRAKPGCAQCAYTLDFEDSVQNQNKTVKYL